MLEQSEEHGWAEFKREQGALLGIAEYDPDFDFQPGSKAVMAISVVNIEEAYREFREKEVRLIGGILESPWEVKMQTFWDADGNTFQLCETLS